MAVTKEGMIRVGAREVMVHIRNKPRRLTNISEKPIKASPSPRRGSMPITLGKIIIIKPKSRS